MTDPVDTADDLFGPRIPAHLYVHVPFCASKCDYCDFASVAGADDDFVEVVFAASVRRSPVGAGGARRRGRDRLLRRRHAVAPRRAGRSDARAHPETCSSSIPAPRSPSRRTPTRSRRTRQWRFARHGVTRVSVGVQSFDDHVLRVLGRRHDAVSATQGLPCGDRGRTGALGRPDVRSPRADDHLVVGDARAGRCDGRASRVGLPAHRSRTARRWRSPSPPACSPSRIPTWPPR